MRRNKWWWMGMLMRSGQVTLEPTAPAQGLGGTTPVLNPQQHLRSPQHHLGRSLLLEPSVPAASPRLGQAGS